MQSFFKSLSAALPQPTPVTADLKGKVAIVTGGASGAGYEVVRHFAKLGCRVIMINKPTDDSAAVIARIKAQPGQTDANIEVVPCDFASLKEVLIVAKEQAEKLERLDLLILCADTKAETFSLTPDGIDQHFAINALAPLILARTLYPVLLKTTQIPGVLKGTVRIVFESSEMHQFCPGSQTAFDGNATTVHFGSEYEINEHGKKLNAIELYGRSKLALIGYTRRMGVDTAGGKINSDVIITSFHSGNTTTDLEEQWKNPLLGNVLKGLHNVFVKDPALGAYPAFYAALSKEVTEKGWDRAYFTDVAIQGRESAQAKDVTLAVAGWELSHRMLERILGAGAIGKV